MADWQGMNLHRRAADDRLSVNNVTGSNTAATQHSFLTRQRMAHIRRQPGATVSPAQIQQSGAQR